MIPMPGVRKECSMCYQLLYVMEWKYETNIEPYYYLGSAVADMVQRRPPEYTVKSFCGGCLVEVQREYIDLGGELRLMRETVYKDERMV